MVCINKLLMILSVNVRHSALKRAEIWELYQVGKVPLPRTSLIEIIDSMALIFGNCFLIPHSSLGPLPRKIYCQHLFTNDHGLPPLNTSLS